VDQYKGALSAGFAVALLAVQFATIAFAPWELAVRIILPATIWLVPLALWVYRGRIGVWVIFVGLAANLAAILANGGLMPIERSTVVEAIGAERAAEYETGSWMRGSKDVLLADGTGRLVVLGDSVIIRAGRGGMVVSPGDIVVWTGLVILAAEASIAWQRRTRTHPSAPATRPQDAGPQAAEGGATT
jgi:hypothetical protein